MKLHDVNDCTNLIGLAIVALGAAISFKLPATGHDMIMAAIGMIGGPALRSALSTLLPPKADNQNP